MFVLQGGWGGGGAGPSLSLPNDAAGSVEGAAPVGGPPDGRPALGVLSAASTTVRTYRYVPIIYHPLLSGPVPFIARNFHRVWFLP